MAPNSDAPKNPQNPNANPQRSPSSKAPNLGSPIPSNAMRPTGTNLRPASTHSPRIVPPLSGRQPAQKPASGAQSQVRATHWNCGGCNKLLTSDSVNKGMAVLQDGRLICIECQVMRSRKPKSSAKDNNLGSFFLKAAGGGILFLAILGIFLPAQACFIGALLGLACLLVGALGLTMEGGTRLILAGGGLALALACAFGISFINSARQAAEASNLLSADIAEVEQLVKADKINEAISKQNTLEKRASTVKGFVSPAAEQAAMLSRQSVEGWFKTNYPGIDGPSRQLLEELLVLFPVRNAGGSLKFRGIKREADKVSAVLAVDDKGEKSDVTTTGAPDGKPLPCGPNVIIEAANVGAKLAGAPRVETVVLEIIAIKDREETTVGTMPLNKQEYMMLQSSQMKLEEIVKQVKFK